MSAADRLGERVPPQAVAWLRQIDSNARTTIATLFRTPRSPMAWPSPAQFLTATLIVIVVLLITMLMFDAWSVSRARRLPMALLAAAGRFTDLGKSGWFLWPTGLVLLALAAFHTPAMPRFYRGILAAWGLRVGFVFVAIGLPSLVATTLKHLIGRARPFVAGTDVWAYEPFSWAARYGSMPSGHTTTAFAALVAIGAIFPQARALMWIYAVLIALSRVVITAHHPSDAIAGAVLGAAGAYLVRNWFAARRLGFTVGGDGSVHTMPGPSLRRIMKAVARRLHSA